ncbi:MAG TPA: RNA 2',3'-cyclic phosphodiesterase [Gemmatimonadaceae bacterium]
MRTFIAANFDAALREQLYAAAAPLRDAAPNVAWVASHLLHVTLKFLGEQQADFVARLTSPLQSLASRHAPGSVRLQGYGAFPNFRAPRVVWMGGEQPPVLASLAGAVDDACAALGIEREQRPFRAHVTLGRVKRELEREEARRLQEAAALRHESFSWHVRSIDIMRSDLGRSGPTYTVLHSLSLAAIP